MKIFNKLLISESLSAIGSHLNAFSETISALGNSFQSITEIPFISLLKSCNINSSETQFFNQRFYVSVKKMNLAPAINQFFCTSVKTHCVILLPYFSVTLNSVIVNFCFVGIIGINIIKNLAQLFCHEVFVYFITDICFVDSSFNG